MKVFLSSPLGFMESATGFRSALRSVLEGMGCEVVDPWAECADLEAELREAQALVVMQSRQTALHDISMRIAERNAERIRECDAMLAVLDGPDVDSGTASEVGYAFALGGKRIHGYRGDFRRAGENDGVIVNLQVQYWIERSGGRIARSVEEVKSMKFEPAS